MRARRATAFGMAIVGLAGCSSQEPVSNVEALRAQFPEQAPLVVEQEGAFRETAHGFTVDAADEASVPRVVADLPRNGEDPIRIRAPGGLEIQVRERGVTGQAAEEGRSIAYRRAGGTSFWTVAAGGLEEWLLLEAGIARAGHVVASWDIEGATLKQRGEAVDVLDADGAARIWITAPAAFTVSGRSVTARLSATRTRLDLTVDAAGEAVLVDSAWLPAVGMGSPRGGHSATLLGNGLVLVAGGSDGGGTMNTAEVYNPVTFTWSPGPSMSIGRRYHTATVLADKRVLVTGGNDGVNGPASTNVQIYNPQSNAWTQAAPMSLSRAHHTAVLLQDGTVLVAGGNANANLSVAEVYDPVANTWTNVAPMSTTRLAPVAVLLDNGQVLLAGGWAGFSPYVTQSTAERYNPPTKSWVPAAPMNAARGFHTATRLDDGKILVTGGKVQGQPSHLTAEIYDQQADTWTLVNPMNHGRSSHAATRLPSGKVLVTGGDTGNNEIFDPATKTWTPAGAFVSGAIIEHTATLLPNGTVMVAGGVKLASGSDTNQVEIWSPSALGVACVSSADCASAFCSDGVCCNSACSGVCEACSVAAGAAANGTCAPTTGTSCDDGNACTQNDTCQNGACSAGNPVACPAAGPCQVSGACNPQTGACSAPVNKPNGAACNDNNPCTQTDKCQAGACVGQNPVVCEPLDECNDAGVCDPATGICSSVPKADGSPCNDGDGCTQTDACQSGFCTGANLVVCAAEDACHVAGSCNPATGLCSNPVGNNGGSCDDGNACTKIDICQSGACVGGNPMICETSDECREPGACDPQAGACSYPAKPNGTPCEKGFCSEGVCQPKEGPSGSSSSSGTGAGGGGMGSGGAGGAGGTDGPGGSGGTGGTDKPDPGCDCSTPGAGASNRGYLALFGLILLARGRGRGRGRTPRPCPRPCP